MLSYKEYKLLNESLYGAFNLGLRSQGAVGGIVSDSPVNGTEAAVEAESEEAIEEAKKMKKKMLGDDEEVKAKHSDEDEHEDDDDHSDDDEHEDEDKDEDENEDEDEVEEGDEDEEDDSDDEKKDFSFMKKKMKKKSKKEWTDVMADLEEILEVVDDEEALTEVKKGLEMMKKGMEKGMEKKMGCGTKKCGKYMSEGKKSHKADCDCPVCDNKKDNDHDDEGGEGLSAAQKKLPKALRDAILAKKGKKKGDKGDKEMNEEEIAWWNSVNGMLGSDPNQKNWDGGWKEVGEVKQTLRDEN